MHSGSIFDAYRELDSQDGLLSYTCEALADAPVPEHQVITLCVRLINKNRSPHENALLVKLLGRHDAVRSLLSYVYPDQHRYNG